MTPMLYKAAGGKVLPTGRPIAQAVASIFRQQNAVANPTQFAQWNKRLREALYPHEYKLIMQGALAAVKRYDLEIDRDELKADAEALALTRATAVAAEMNRTSMDRVEESDPFTAARAASVGVTEGSWAVHAGEQLALKQGGIGQWQWMTHPKCCDVCKKLSGKIIKVGGKFRSGDFDVEHPPLHVNCRCSLKAVASGGNRIMTGEERREFMTSAARRT